MCGAKKNAFSFTPAAQRRLIRAAKMAELAGESASAGKTEKNEFSQVEPVHFLAALAEDTDSHLVAFLAQRGVTPETWCAAFPAVKTFFDLAWKVSEAACPVGENLDEDSRFSQVLTQRLSFALETAIHHGAAEFAFHQPLEISTDIIFYGLVKTDPAVARFLETAGITESDLRRHIAQTYHYDDSPLGLPDDFLSVPEGKVQEVITQEEKMTDEKSQNEITLLPPENAAVMRILDASANRAAEALRVLEDYVRFSLDDAHLAGRLKRMRHSFSVEISAFPLAERLAARDTLADVGTGISTRTEFHRTDVSHVLAANFSRLQEALRSMEEFSKMNRPDAARVFESLRYESYTLQKAVFFTVQNTAANADHPETDTRRKRLAAAKLYVLTDGATDENAFRWRVNALLDGGVHVIQLREKKADDATLLRLGRILRECISEREAGTLFIMNDRPDLAILARADGVHVGQEELSVRDVRTLCGPGMLVGVSTHSITQAREAVLAGADYIGVGPTFPSITKDFAAFPGLTLLTQVAAEIRLPAFAIGGITDENLAQVLETGIIRVAVSSSVTAYETEAAMTEAAVKLNEKLGRRN